MHKICDRGKIYFEYLLLAKGPQKIYIKRYPKTAMWIRIRIRCVSWIWIHVLQKRPVYDMYRYFSVIL